MDESLFKQIVEQANDIIIVTRTEPLDDLGPEIVYVNEAFLRLTGYTRKEILGRTPRILQGPDTSPESRREIRQ